MHRLPPPTPSTASTYCSDLEYKGNANADSQILRRSQRLIDKENQELAKTSTPKCRSPQLFGESEDIYSQLLCQQEEPSSKVVLLKEKNKVESSKTSEKLVQLKASGTSDKVIDLKSSGNIETSAKILHLNMLEDVQKENVQPPAKILHLKQQEDVKQMAIQEAVPQKNLKRKRTYQSSSQPAAKLRAKTPLNRHEAVKTPLYKKHLCLSPNSSQSKLPPKYPEHFEKQLKDMSFVHLQANLAPERLPLKELCPTPESTPTAATPAGIWNKASPTVDSENSSTISLSDSICEIFGSKDVNDILNIKAPRKFILLEEHLPAVATMLNVEVDRLRNVLEITQRLSHDQILGLPIKREPSSTSDVPVPD